jgi:hypothetical protein
MRQHPEQVAGGPRPGDALAVKGGDQQEHDETQ